MLFALRMQFTFLGVGLKALCNLTCCLIFPMLIHMICSPPILLDLLSQYGYLLNLHSTYSWRREHCKVFFYYKIRNE